MWLSALVPALALAIAPLVIAPPAAEAVGPGGWDHLGTGATPTTSALNNDVLALSSDLPGKLVVGGKFVGAGGIAGADRIATWNGASWSAVGPAGSIAGEVRAVAVSGTKIIVGGIFDNAGGVTTADKLAVWDGLIWSSPCVGTPLTGNVDALRVVGNDLYVGGEFQDGFGLPNADYLAKCDLTTGAVSVTTSVASFPGPVYALAADTNGRVYAGGNFQNLDGNTASDYVAGYSGGTWTPLGFGPVNSGHVTGIVRSLATNGTTLYIGSDGVNIAGLAQADHVARWDGSQWSPLSSDAAGTNGYLPAVTSVFALLSLGSHVYASGDWQNVGGNAKADFIADFDGSSWQTVGTNGGTDGPLNAKAEALALFDGRVHVGGNFTSAGGDPMGRFVARYAGFVPINPSNAVKLPKVTRVPKNGSAKMSVAVPGAGHLLLTGQGIKKAGKSVAGAGTVVLKVRPKGKLLRKLRAHGKAKVKVTVTFSPTGGTPASVTKKVKLVLKPR